MSRDIAVGIDVGTHHVKVVIAEAGATARSLPKILGTGLAESKGLRHGYITNSGDVTRAIVQAVSQAEKAAGMRVREAYVSVGGVGLAGSVSQGAAVVSRADSEITELDVAKVHEICESEIPSSIIQNRRVIYAIPILYKIDGKPVLGKPLGMKGMRLEAKMLFVTCLEPHLNDAVQAVEDAGIEVIDAVAGPIAASFVTLTKTQKIAGCVLANIGAETVSIVVFENNIPISLEVFQIGSTDITNDIALGLRISIEEAEQIKVGAVTATQYPRKKLEEIVDARLSDIFDLIENHLRKIGRSGLLPAGVIITGGGSGINGIDDFAKSALKLPARIGSITFGDEKGTMKDSTWAVAYGLCILGFSNEPGGGKLKLPGKSIFNAVWEWLKQFLP